ncbi:gxcDD [Acrasis kona]|uniref:GxcDD n=1 Tax=Acrasis kona TaxID=1008807 RepID=A0AAW2YTF6_9EUKA
MSKSFIETERTSCWTWFRNLFCCSNSVAVEDSKETPLLRKEEKDEIVEDPSREILSPKQIRDYFGQITLILNVNKSFLSDLEGVVQKNGPADILGNELRFAEIILFRAYSFKLYSSFMSSFDMISKAIKSERQVNHDFNLFIESQQKYIKKINKHPHMENTLAGFMIAPVQRICRYNLLVTELCRATSNEISPTNDADAETLNKLLQARDLISEVAQYCNEKTREMSGSARVLVLQQLLKKNDIIAPHRVVVRESDRIESIQYKKAVKNSIMSQLNKKKATKSCRLHLFNDILIVSKDPTVEVKDTSKELVFVELNLWSANTMVRKKDKSKRIIETDRNFTRKVCMFKDNAFIGTLKFSSEVHSDSWLESIKVQMDKSSEQISIKEE